MSATIKESAAAALTPHGVDEHRRVAIERAKEVSRALRRKGVDVKVIGSLAKGGFSIGSDVDFLVVRCPIEQKYRIEAEVEDTLSELTFDVLYLDELSPYWQERTLKEATYAESLR